METNINTSGSANSSKSAKDPETWKTAQRRASFKYHALIYFIVNIFFWTLWYINLRNDPAIPAEKDFISWPV